ncbi:hypothetical protein [Flavobacterium sp.]|uniref:hypothetical protein n=1 Tax=Flavobacterium sp. TaxID=239 RepID=UPI0038CFAB3B
MSIEEIENQYLTENGMHLKPINKETIIREKKDLYDILGCWTNKNPGPTIGDLANMNKNKKLILLQIGSSDYYINADSRVSGVKEFLLNQDNPWKLIVNNRGVRNKVTNSIGEEPIPYFYMYKKI